MPEVRICEMTPRDGLQSLDRERTVPVDKKVALIGATAAAGFDFIEVGSFVSPRAVPQLADTDEVCQKLTLRDGVAYAALVTTMKHYDRFKASGLNMAAVFISASEAYSQFNLRMSIADSVVAQGAVASAVRADGKRLRAHLSACFQDIDGSDMDVKPVIELTHQLIEMGCEHVALADTKGTTNPRRVRAIVADVLKEFDASKIAVHFHDSYGMGVANVLAAYESGVRIFDAGIGGIGGTPFRTLAKGPGGGGNVATEELVYMFDSLGIPTGLDFDAVMRAGEMVREIAELTGDAPLPSKLLR